MISAISKFFDGFAARFRKSEQSAAEPVVHPNEMLSNYPLPESLALAQMQDGRCFFCGGTDWREGPSGGASTNIRCDDCGQKLNVCAVAGTVLICDTIGFDELKRTAYLSNPIGKNGRHIRDATETVH